MDKRYWKKKISVSIKTINLCYEEIDKLELETELYKELLNKELLKVKKYREYIERLED